MTDLTSNPSPTFTSDDPLAAAYHAAASAHVATLKSGTAREILTAFRAVLVAEIALLRSCPGAFDLATADAISYDLADVDRELADLVAHHQSANASRP